jgi:cold shock CspA family protein
MVGKIKSLVGHRGFGFIRSANQEYFFHRSAFTGFWDDTVEDFEKGNEIEVEFTPVNGERGMRAVDVKRTDRGVVME